MLFTGTRFLSFWGAVCLHCLGSEKSGPRTATAGKLPCSDGGSLFVIDNEKSGRPDCPPDSPPPPPPPNVCVSTTLNYLRGKKIKLRKSSTAYAE